MHLTQIRGDNTNWFNWNEINGPLNHKLRLFKLSIIRNESSKQLQSFPASGVKCSLGLNNTILIEIKARPCHPASHRRAGWWRVLEEASLYCYSAVETQTYAGTSLYEAPPGCQCLQHSLYIERFTFPVTNHMCPVPAWWALCQLVFMVPNVSAKTFAVFNCARSFQIDTDTHTLSFAKLDQV